MSIYPNRLAYYSMVLQYGNLLQQLLVGESNEHV